MVAFRTLPEDDTGVAHILEHTVLCGSRRYPVNDPFFGMLRRSLHTYMNAMTASDWTAYPFATNHRKDYFNLMDVYLDAVFAPRLTALSFAQEGHRLVLSDNDTLSINGVVFNEMKGARDSPTHHLWNHLSAGLFPDTPLRHSSGGEPEAIAQLTHAQLRTFHRRHYCPANALILTCGSIAAQDIQERVAPYLSGAKSVGAARRYERQTPFEAPRSVRTSFPDYGTQTKSMHVLAWVLCPSDDIDQVLAMQLLYSCLLGDSSAPLRRALQRSGLGTRAGLDSLMHEMSDITLTCGLEDVQDPDAVTALIERTLTDLSDNGIDPELIETSLHQFELDQRALDGGGGPWGLDLLLEALPALLYGSDAAARIDTDKALKRLIMRSRDPDWIPQLIRRYLLDNPHRLELHLTPDIQLAEREARRQRRELSQRGKALSPAERERIRRLNRALSQQQEETQDNSVLPTLELSDIRREPTRLPPGSRIKMSTASVYRHSIPANGLVHVSVNLPLGSFDFEELKELHRFTQFADQLGVGEMDYAEWTRRKLANSGGLSTFVDIGPFGIDHAVDCDQNMHGYLRISNWGLRSKHKKVIDLIDEWLGGLRWDEADRILELTVQKHNAMRRSIGRSGHRLAMGQAAAAHHPLSMLRLQCSGLDGIVRWDQFKRDIETPAGMREFAGRMGALQQQLLRAAPRQIGLIGERAAMNSLSQCAEQIAGPAEAELDSAASSYVQLAPPNSWISRLRPSGGPLDSHRGLYAQPQVEDTAWLIPGEVNYCARAIPCPLDERYAFKDAAALHVVAALLNHSHLHRELREKGGAYGGGAGFDSQVGVMLLYSYRDPHLERTLGIFSESLTQLVHEGVSQTDFDEAVIAALGRSESSSTPLSLAQDALHASLWHSPASQRKARRASYFDLDRDYVLAAAETYLLNTSTPSTALLIGNNRTRSQAGKWVSSVREELA